jgi:hypothetical protein
MNDFAKLRHWIELVRGNQVALGRISQTMAAETLKLIQVGFNTETDPYEKRWAPKKRPDGRKVLRGKTGRLRRGWHFRRVTARGYDIFPSVDYATPHQEPRDKRRPARRMVPSKALGVPRRWTRALTRSAVAAMKKHFEGP